MNVVDLKIRERRKKIEYSKRAFRIVFKKHLEKSYFRKVSRVF